MLPNYKISPKGAEVDHEHRYAKRPVSPGMCMIVSGQNRFIRISRFELKELNSNFECDTEGARGVQFICIKFMLSMDIFNCFKIVFHFFPEEVVMKFMMLLQP